MKKYLLLLLTVTLCVSLLTACGKTNEKSTPPVSNQPAQVSDDNTGDGNSAGLKAGTLPLVQEPVTFTCFWPLGSTDIVDYADELFFSEMAKRTNVYIKFQHPSTVSGMGAAVEAFNLMIASQDYPDFIKGFYAFYAPGVDDGVAQKIIAPLNDYTEYMPNYMKLINGNDEIKIRCYSDGGNLWGIQHIVDRPQDAYMGPTVRTDMLKDIGYTKAPTTIADWEDMLTQLKNHFPQLSDGPLYIANNASSAGYTLSSAFGVGGYTTFINVDGKVKYSPLEKGYREYLELLANWYSKGLIYKELATETLNIGPVPLVSNDKLALFDGIYSMYDTDYKKSATDADFDLAGLPYPVKNEGDVLHLRQSNAWCRSYLSLSISSTCPNLPLACRYWDYGYSDDGKILSNYGVEGNTFEYDKNGKPKYTDLVTKYELGISAAMTKYVLFNSPGFCYWDREQQGFREQLIDATRTWTKAGDDWVYPDGPTLNAEEGQEYSTLFADIQPYVLEYSLKLITGQESFNSYDQFIEGLTNMKVQRVVELKQAALDRYYNRLKVIK